MTFTSEYRKMHAECGDWFEGSGTGKGTYNGGSGTGGENRRGSEMGDPRLETGSVMTGCTDHSIDGLRDTGRLSRSQRDGSSGN